MNRVEKVLLVIYMFVLISLLFTLSYLLFSFAVYLL